MPQHMICTQSLPPRHWLLFVLVNVDASHKSGAKQVNKIKSRCPQPSCKRSVYNDALTCRGQAVVVHIQ